MSINDLIANTGQRVAQDGDSILQTFAYAQQQQKRSALADLASKAAGGDRAALNQVAGLDPQTYQQLAGGLAKMDEQQRAKYKDTIDQFGKIALWADTPEKWDYAVGMLSKQYPDVAQYKGQFSAREPFIAQARTIKETLDSGTIFTGGRVQPIPGSIEAGAAKVGAETAAKEANSYQSFAPGNMVIPPQGSVLSRLAAQPNDGQNAAPRQAPQVPEVFQGLVSQHAERTGLSPQLVGAVLMRESGGNPNAVSDKGAQGLMQVMPGTARDPGYGVQPARDASPEENVRVGTDYLAAMMQKYGGNEKLALAAYNWGPQAVDDWLASGADPRKVPGETQRYVYKITGGFLSGQQGQPAQQPGRVQVADASGGMPAVAFIVPKPLEPTAEQRDYNLAKSQGFQGSFMDYQTALKRAGKPETTIDMKGEGEEAKAEGKRLVDEFQGVQQRGQAAQDALAQINIARTIPEKDANGNALPGVFKQQIGNVAVALGFNPESPTVQSVIGRVSDGQSFNGVMQHLVLTKMQAQKGPQTETDAKRIESTVASLGNTPAARDFLLRTSTALAQRDVDQQAFYEQWKANSKSYAGASKAWREHLSSIPLVGTQPSTGKTVFFNEFRDAYMRQFPDAPQDKMLNDWRTLYAGR